jgi:hypothetical protein
VAKPEELVALCLHAADHDIRVSLAEVIDRVCLAYAEPSPFRLREHSNFKTLLTCVPRFRFDQLQEVLLSPEQVDRTPFANVIVHMLRCDEAHSSDTDVGWYVFKNDEGRRERARFRHFVSSREAKEPERLRTFVRELIPEAVSLLKRLSAP